MRNKKKRTRNASEGRRKVNEALGERKREWEKIEKKTGITKRKRGS